MFDAKPSRQDVAINLIIWLNLPDQQNWCRTNYSLVLRRIRALGLSPIIRFWRYGRTKTASYQPIENYGIIGNMRTVALVGVNWSIDWYCYPL